MIKNSLTPEDIETANRVAPYMDNIKETISKSVFRWTQQGHNVPPLAEGAERVRFEEDTLIITSFKGIPGEAKWSLNKDALEHKITVHRLHLVRQIF